ncbi:MAG: hypothetical protein KBT28_12415 [Bacteroidales bacterium]|nr:hypothetical protein [Candidatus Colimorpha merdihippi]
MLEIEVEGIPCLFDDAALNDFEMLEHLANFKKGDVTHMVPFALGIFGEEQLDNIKSQLRSDDGVVKITDMGRFIGEAMEKASEAKKAESKN